MKKVLLASLLALAVVVGGAFWWLNGSMDSLVAKAVRNFGPEILGVSVRLDSAHIKPVDGSASLQGLDIGNPAGFHTDRAFVADEISMKLDTGTLTKDVVVIHEIVVQAPRVTYEQASGGSNLDVIQRNIQSYIDKKSDGKSSGKKLVIENLYVRNGKVSVSHEMLKGKSMTVTLPEIHLKDIGKSSGGVTPEQAARQVVGSITQAATSVVTNLHLDSVSKRVTDSVSSGIDKVKGWFKK